MPNSLILIIPISWGMPLSLDESHQGAIKSHQQSEAGSDANPQDCPLLLSPPQIRNPFCLFVPQSPFFIMLFCSFQKILSHFSILLLIILTATSIHQGSDGIVKVTWVKTLFAIAGGGAGRGATWGQWGAQRGIKKEETEQGNIWGKTVPGWIHINQIGKCKAGAGKFRWARLLHISCTNYCFSFSNRMSLCFLWTLYKTYIFFRIAA